MKKMYIGLMVVAILGLLFISGCQQPITPSQPTSPPKNEINVGGQYNLVNNGIDCLKYVKGNDLIGGCYTKGEERPNTLIGQCNQNQDCMVQLNQATILYGDKWECSDFSFSTCPSECTSICKSVCSREICTNDCDGVGSCR